MKGFLILLAVSLALHSCDSNSQASKMNEEMPTMTDSSVETEDLMPQPGDGTVNTFEYTSDYFKFTIPFPPSWQCMPTQAGNSSNDDANTTTLCTMLKFKSEDTYYFNPSMLILAENVSSSPDVHNGKLYLELAETQLLKSDKRYEFPQKITKTVLGNLEFYKLTARTLVNENVRQEYYAAVHDGYALIFILTADNEEDLNTLQNSLQRLNFF